MARATVTSEEAEPLIAALIARRVDGPLPPLSTGETYLDIQADHERLSLAERLPLHARALFAAETLDDAARLREGITRDGFFAALGAAVGLSARGMLAAVRAGRFPLSPPRTIHRYEYLGPFASDGRLEVADPYNLRKRGKIDFAFALSVPVDAHPGVWHAYVRAGRGDAAGRTAELAVIHDDGFDVVAADEIANIGVDAGMAGVFDHECPEPETAGLFVESVVHGRGAFARSGYGDGIYPVFAGELGGKVAKLRLAFLEDERPAFDATLYWRPIRRYAISATFAVGDTIEHPKFGAGVVIGAIDGKIAVEFDDGRRRALVHGR